MPKPYHHGDLGPALLQAAMEILEQDGLAGLSLRAIARRAGVSHMAPAHHFTDLAGLLSELAAAGYARFAASLLHAQAEPDGRAPARATAQAYVAFAQANPALFLLMFRAERLDFARPALAKAAQSASLALMRTRGASSAAAPPALALARAVFDWSLVHGFAMLLIDGRLQPMLDTAATGWDFATLLDAALDAGLAA